MIRAPWIACGTKVVIRVATHISPVFQSAQVAGETGKEHIKTSVATCGKVGIKETFVVNVLSRQAGCSNSSEYQKKCGGCTPVATGLGYKSYTVTKICSIVP